TDPALGIPVTGTKIDAGRSFNSNGTDLSNGEPATIETSINAVFGRAAYSWSDRYFAEVDFRYDGSSKFAKGNRWGFFPSVSAGWRISEEAFMDNLRATINNLKVRGSYGILGNQNVRAYQYQTTFNSNPNVYGFNNTVVSGSGFNLGNPDL